MDGLMNAGDIRLQTQGNIGFGGPASSRSDDTLKEKAKQLEGVFLTTLMKQMFSSIKTKGTFGGGFAEETWRSMQAEQYATMIAENGGVGLADQIMSNLLATQEHHQGQPPSTQIAQGAYTK